MEIFSKHFILLITYINFASCLKHSQLLFSYPVDVNLLPTDPSNSEVLETYAESKMSCAVICVEVACVSSYFDSNLQLCYLQFISLDSRQLTTAHIALGQATMFYIDTKRWTTTTSTTTSTTTTTTTSTTSTTTTTTLAPVIGGNHVTKTLGPLDLKVDDRVTRGPDWEWGDQDGGAGGQGSITDVTTTTSGWVRVLWDTGYENEYRNGAMGMVDLALVIHT